MESFTHPLNNIQKLYRKLLHICPIIPRGQAYLTKLEAMLYTGSDCPFMSYSEWKGLQEDLQWWTDILQQPVIIWSIPQPISPYNARAFYDMSLGIVIREHWRAWHLIPGWKTLNRSRDISWAKAIGFELLARALINTVTELTHFLINEDNIGIVKGWWNGQNRNPRVNTIFKCIHMLLQDSRDKHSLYTIYIWSKRSLADGPSKGIYPSLTLLLPPIPLLPGIDKFLIDSEEPLSPTKQRLLHEGVYPTAIAKVSTLLISRMAHAGTSMSTMLPISSPIPRNTGGHNGCHNASLPVTKPHPYQPGLTQPLAPQTSLLSTRLLTMDLEAIHYLHWSWQSNQIVGRWVWLLAHCNQLLTG